MDWIRCTTEQMVERLRNGNTANLPMEQVADRLEAHQKEHCNRLDEVRKMQADYAALLARAESAEKERDKADATWILALKEIAALKTERDHFAERSKMVEAETNRLKEALTPSADTKAAYMGELTFKVNAFDSMGYEAEYVAFVPWDTIKEVMKMIRERAALNGGINE